MRVSEVKVSPYARWSPTALAVTEEDGLRVKLLTDFQEMTEAYQLRHLVFCEELGWVPRSEYQLEMDEYDRRAVPFGILDGDGNLLAFLRVIGSDGPFMIEREFSHLIGGDHAIRKVADTVEVSRLCVAADKRRQQVKAGGGGYPLFMLLTKGLYHWCLRHGVRYMYLVVEQKVHRLLSAKGLSSRLVGEPQLMPDGVMAMAAILDWREFEESSAVKHPRLLEWFTEGLSTPRRRQWRRRGSGLPRRACA